MCNIDMPVKPLLSEPLREHAPVVYYLTNAVAPDGVVKIGTTNCVVRRMRDFTRKHPGFVPMLLAVEWGNRELELLRHMQFKEDRVIGNADWFWRSPVLNEHISAVADQL